MPTVRTEHGFLFFESRIQGISQSVADLGNPKIEYVDTSEFDGTGLCDTYTPYINGVEVTGLNNLEPESMHPNVDGMQLGYGATFLDEITK